MASPTTGLQRSSISFRRQGSSGLVWEDKRNISGEQSQPKSKQTNDHRNHQLKAKEQRITSGSTPAVTMDRIRSGGERRWRSGKALPAVDPPSPRVSGCGFCGVFGNKLEGQKKQKQRRRRQGGRRRSMTVVAGEVVLIVCGIRFFPCQIHV